MTLLWSPSFGSRFTISSSTWDLEVRDSERTHWGQSRTGASTEETGQLGMSQPCSHTGLGPGLERCWDQGCLLEHLPMASAEALAPSQHGRLRVVGSTTCQLRVQGQGFQPTRHTPYCLCLTQIQKAGNEASAGLCWQHRVTWIQGQEGELPSLQEDPRDHPKEGCGHMQGFSS